MGATTVVTEGEHGDEIERLYFDGRVHRWSRRVSGRMSGWPGHTTFVALKGGEVVVGDRYAGEGVERTYACDLASLLEGCFQDLVTQQLGPRVLEELLVEVRRELGALAPATGKGAVAGAAPGSGPAKVVSAPTASERPPAPPPAAPTPAASKPAAPTPAASKPAAPTPAASKPAASKPAAPTPAVSTPAVSKPAASKPAVATPSVEAKPATGVPAAGVASTGPVDLSLVACPGVSLPLAVALRGITRAPVHEVLARLRSLPCRVAAGVPRQHAEAVAARLAELGAEVRLLPAGGS